MSAAIDKISSWIYYTKLGLNEIRQYGTADAVERTIRNATLLIDVAETAMLEYYVQGRVDYTTRGFRALTEVTNEVILHNASTTQEDVIVGLHHCGNRFLFSCNGVDHYGPEQDASYQITDHDLWLEAEVLRGILTDARARLRSDFVYRKEESVLPNRRRTADLARIPEVISTVIDVRVPKRRVYNLIRKPEEPTSWIGDNLSHT